MKTRGKITYEISNLRLFFFSRKMIFVSILMRMDLIRICLLAFLPICLFAKKSDELVDVQTYIPTLQVDLKYATNDNFTGVVIYPFLKCYLLKEVALHLQNVQNELQTMGLGLKIWDGFRPLSAQWKLWELVPDERYVSNPRKGGRHTRGTAVDVTLVTTDGQELLMPSGFDDFSEKAHRDYANASEEALSHRALLQQVMEKHGFIGFPFEWWHFDFMGWEDYESLDITFSEDNLSNSADRLNFM